MQPAVADAANLSLHNHLKNNNKKCWEFEDSSSRHFLRFRKSHSIGTVFKYPKDN